MRHFKLGFLFLLLVTIPVNAGSIKSAEGLISAMHKKYAGKWYKTLTFVQKNTQYRRDGTTQNSTWYEAMSVPGRLHVDFGSPADDNGMLFVGGKQYIYRQGKLNRSQPMIHSLLVLGFDVYHQSPETTIDQLKKLKFDLSIIREDKWQGRLVYVVGAKTGDNLSRQFWIDKKNLYFVRSLRGVGKDGKALSETQFNKYQKVKGGGWVAPEVVFMINGKPTFKEEYTQMQFNVELNEDLFDPKKWKDVEKTYYMKKKAKG